MIQFQTTHHGHCPVCEQALWSGFENEAYNNVGVNGCCLSCINRLDLEEARAAFNVAIERLENPERPFAKEWIDQVLVDLREAGFALVSLKSI